MAALTPQSNPDAPAGRRPYDVAAMTQPDDTGPRTGSARRKTAETEVSVSVVLDGTGVTRISTGLPFFDHMLAQLGRHGSIDLEVEAKGDLEVDGHHLVEDTGIILGAALNQALGDRLGIARFASRSVPLDEALVDVALDCSARPYLYWEVDFAPNALALGNPGFEPQLAEEFWRAMVGGAGLTLHVQLRRGRNSHHILEAVFKGVALSLRDAVGRVSRSIPSTKGVLS
jgi:imidazoleglycerol-phosphate dehydratase